MTVPGREDVCKPERPACNLSAWSRVSWRSHCIRPVIARHASDPTLWIMLYTHPKNIVLFSNAITERALLMRLNCMHASEMFCLSLYYRLKQLEHLRSMHPVQTHKHSTFGYGVADKYSRHSLCQSDRRTVFQQTTHSLVNLTPITTTFTVN